MCPTLHIVVPELSCAICIRFTWQIAQDNSGTTIFISKNVRKNPAFFETSTYLAKPERD
jgi:hypothetical protein